MTRGTSDKESRTKTISEIMKIAPHTKLNPFKKRRGCSLLSNVNTSDKKTQDSFMASSMLSSV